MRGMVQALDAETVLQHWSVLGNYEFCSWSSGHISVQYGFDYDLHCVRLTESTESESDCQYRLFRVVREGGADLLIHVLFIILLGSGITNLVCFVLWPQSATSALK